MTIEVTGQTALNKFRVKGITKADAIRWIYEGAKAENPDVGIPDFDFDAAEGDLMNLHPDNAGTEGAKLFGFADADGDTVTLTLAAEDRE